MSRVASATRVLSVGTNHTDRLTELGERRRLALAEAQAIELDLYSAILDAHADGVPTERIGEVTQMSADTVHAIVQRIGAEEDTGNTTGG